MRPLPWFVVLSVALVLPAQGLLPCPLPDDVAATVQKVAGQDAFAVLRVLGGMDLEARAAARAKWDTLDVRARCAVVRAGLRSTDQEVATGAAAMAKLEWLDAAECKRAAAVGLA